MDIGLQNEKLLKRFLKYVSFDTHSNPESSTSPSTPNQLKLAQWLVDELKSFGVANAHIGKGGVVYGFIEATKDCEDSVPVGFLAHMDTSPDASGNHPAPKVIKYEGGDIVLNKEKGIVFSEETFKEIDHYLGQEVIVTDGNTLLGADDKAGIAEIMGMVEYLHEHPEVPHARICVAFTPDEEIARGTENFDLEQFGAKYAYTFDGDEIGNLEGENFNAAGAVLIVKGVGVHPGKAKNKMVNAVRIAADFISKLPADQAPETTEDREGFFHPDDISGSVTEAKVELLIRDHDQKKFEERKKFLEELVDKLKAKYPRAKIELQIKDRYKNMKQYLDKAPKVMEIARKAYRMAGIEPKDVPIRGGTDGANLSQMGLPCPNIFSGGMNYHGIFEYLPVRSLQKARDIAINLAKLSASVKSLD